MNETKVVRLNEHTWMMEDGNVRFFLLEGREKALLVDTGRNMEHIRELAEALTLLPLRLLNTHADPDHTSCNSEFECCYMHPSEAMVYHKVFGQKGQICPVWDGDILDLGGREVEIIHLPGHTPGSIALLDHKYRALFGGDSVQDGQIYMFGIHRDMFSYTASLERLAARMDEFDVVYPSHASIPVKPELITKLINGAKAVTGGEAEGRLMELRGRKIRAYDTEGATFLCDAE